MKCIDCNGIDNLIEFKQDDDIVYICEECWHDKVDKGSKNHDSFINRYKDLKGISRDRQV